MKRTLDPQQPFSISVTERGRRTFKNVKYKAQSTSIIYSLVPTVLPQGLSILDIINEMRKTLSELIERSLQHVAPSDQVRLVLSHKDLDFPVITAMVRKLDLTSDMLCERIMKVYQSKRNLLFHGLLSLEVLSIAMPRGGGGRNGFRSKDSTIDLNSWLKNSNVVVRIKSDPDGNCLARAICISKAKADGLVGNDWKYLRENVSGRLDKAAANLTKKAGVSLLNREATFSDLSNFQKVLEPDYQLLVVTPEGGKNIYLKDHLQINNYLLSCITTTSIVCYR